MPKGHKEKYKNWNDLTEDIITAINVHKFKERFDEFRNRDRSIQDKHPVSHN